MPLSRRQTQSSRYQAVGKWALVLEDSDFINQDINKSDMSIDNPGPFSRILLDPKVRRGKTRQNEDRERWWHSLDPIDDTK